MSLDIARLDSFPVWLLPSCDLAVQCLNDSVTAPANYSVGILVERFWYFASVFAKCPYAHNTLTMFLSVRDLPVNPFAIFGLAGDVHYYSALLSNTWC